MAAEDPHRRSLREAHHHAHVFSLFGQWCYLCGHKKRWWAFWETWTDEEHDERSDRPSTRRGDV